MLISASLPSPLNTGRLPLSRRQPHGSESSHANLLPEVARQALVSSDGPARQVRFVMPDNATTRRGQIALREYQTIQHGGEAELVNRVDLRV